MARTVTTIQASTAIGGAATSGEVLFHQTTLEATTLYTQLEAALTNGAASGNRSKIIRLRYAFSSVSYTTLATAKALLPSTRVLDLIPALDPSGTFVTITPLHRFAAAYLYTWFEAATLDAEAAIVLTATQI